jgi:hypothetical protein
MLLNAMLQDKRMSLEARGALAFVMSQVTHWSFNQAWLANEARIGRKKVQRIVREWTDRGYCWRSQSRQSTGRHGAAEYLFSDEAHYDPRPRSENPSDGFNRPRQNRH